MIQGESLAFPANATQFESDDCQSALEGLDNIETVTCTRGDVDATGGAAYDIGA